MEPGGCRWVAPRYEGGNAEALEHPPVSQRRAFRCDNGAAGGYQHRVAGGHVPFTRGREARIDVGGSFGELTEFHRRSARAPIGDRQSRQERLRLRFEMRAANHRNETGAWRRPRSNRATLLRCARRSSGRQTQPLGAAALDPTPEDSPRRGANDTETRTSAAHQRNIDRELVPPGDELSGAVEGVDQDKAAGDALRERAPHRLLRHHAHAGKHAGESFKDHRLGCVIGGGDRGEIGLGPDLERTRACRENGGCRGRDDGGEFVEQPAVHSDDVVVRSQARRLLMWWICILTIEAASAHSNSKTAPESSICQRPKLARVPARICEPSESGHSWYCRFESWQVERLRCISGAMVLSRAQHSPLRRPEAGLPETSSCP